MKAIIYENYGSPEVLKLAELPLPEPEENQIRVKIHATAVNSADWRLRKADPFVVRFMLGLSKPRKKVLGSVFSGIVDAVGSSASRFKVGDAIYGVTEMHLGNYAEYNVIPENLAINYKPENLDHGEAVSILFGGHTALYFFRKSNIQKGQEVMIYGASGAVGTAAVQLAKYYGARVTAVCSGANAGLVRSLGADEVIDYKTQDIYNTGRKYDVIFETVNKTSVPRMGKMILKGGFFLLGAGLVKEMFQGMRLSVFRGVKVIAGSAKVNSEGLYFLKERAEEGSFKPVIDRRYKLEEMAQAHAYVEEGHKKGNVVITV